jgi:hypothetical protein
MILTCTDATFSWPRGYKPWERMQEQRWDFQADGSGRRRLPVEGVHHENLPLEGGSVISEREKDCICVTMESGVRTYGCMLQHRMGKGVEEGRHEQRTRGR